MNTTETASPRVHQVDRLSRHCWASDNEDGTVASDFERITRCHQEHVLKLVTDGFCRELTHYGVPKPGMLTVATHILDHVIEKSHEPPEAQQYYNQFFNLQTIRDEWTECQTLSVDDVSIRPFGKEMPNRLCEWLGTRDNQNGFVTRFPTFVDELRRYFSRRTRMYFSIFFQGEPVGLIGADNIDRRGSRVEMKKLVGQADRRGLGIGKRATFAFLYYVYVIAQFEKVIIYSTDVNIRNLNLNRKSGFQLEGVYRNEARIDGGWHDVVRMGLLRSDWLRIFASPNTSPRPSSGVASGNWG